MSYGKLTIHLEVLDAIQSSDDYKVLRNSRRLVRLLTHYDITQEAATKHAMYFISLNVAKDQRDRLRVIWQEHPVEIDVE